jgi:Bacterial protein of unknown function (DUF937)
MLKDLISSLGGPLTAELGKKFDLSPDKVEGTVSTTSDTVLEGLKDQALSGNVGGLLSLFQGKTDLGSNPIVSGLVQQVASGLAQKVGLSADMANNVSKFAVPFIMQQLTQKTATEGNMNENKIAEMFGGDIAKNVLGKLGGGDMGSMLGGFFK